MSNFWKKFKPFSSDVYFWTPKTAFSSYVYLTIGTGPLATSVNLWFCNKP